MGPGSACDSGEHMWQWGTPLVMEVLIQPSPVGCGKQQMEQEAEVLGSALLGMVEVQLVRGHCQPLPQLAGAHCGTGLCAVPSQDTGCAPVQCRGRDPVLESALAIPATWQSPKTIPALC